MTEDEQKHIESGKPTYVLDWGALLHKIPWDIDKTYKAICQSYVSHVKKYGKPVIVLDSYQTGPTPKDGMQARHTATKSAVPVQFNEGMSLQMKKHEFLSNKENKQCFINLLGKHLEMEGFEVLHAKGTLMT